MKTKNEYREHLADVFIKAIEEDGLQWKKGWVGMEAPKSAITDMSYKGINRFILGLETLDKGYKDSRWATFKQIQDKGWRLEKGSKGVQIEFWLPIHPETGKPTTWDKINELKKENPELNVKSVPQYYYVYNGDKIQGIPERQYEPREIKVEDIVPKISKNMGVEILNDGGNRAFYRPSEDKIHLPEPSQFLSSYDYYATAMHELAHASGAEHRLNRDLSGIFGSPSYAFEELVAEMSATFMSEHLTYELPAEQLESHKAYLNSWMSAIKDNPDYLVQAIKKADLCADYLEEMGEMNLELQKELQTELKPENMTMEQRYTEALKIAGYEIIPTPEGSPATVTIKDLETGYEMGSDGWRGIGEYLEEMKITDESARTKIDSLIHPEGRLSYYLEGIDVGLIKYPNFDEALKAYVDLDVQCKQICCHIENEPGFYDKDYTRVCLAYYNTVENKHMLDRDIYHEDKLAPNEFKELEEKNPILEATMNRENAYAQVLDGFRDVYNDVKVTMMRNSSLDANSYGRIVNNGRPQDYIQFEIMGLERRNLTMTYVRVPNHNTQNFGSTYGQNIEPAGEYMSMDTSKGKYKIEGYEYGIIQFNKPLVLEHINTSDTGWKKTVSDMYNGLTGRELSNALIKDGYDSIVTYDENGYNEIVNLNGTKLNDSHYLLNDKNINILIDDKEISAMITSVHANEVVDIKDMEIKLPSGNFEQTVEQAFEQIGSYFTKENNFIKKAVLRLDTDYDKPFTLYAPFMEKSLDEHYKALGDRGYEAFPNYDNWIQQKDEKVDISLSDNVENTKTELSEKKSELLKQVVNLDIARMDLQKNIESTSDEIRDKIYQMAAEDILQKGDITPETSQLMEAYSVSKELPCLSNVQQLDKAKGSIHLFQDKMDSSKNYIGRKIEKNGVKMVQKLSSPMELKTASDKFKEVIKNQPEQQLQKNVKHHRAALSMERGR